MEGPQVGNGEEMRREQTAVSCNLCVGQKHPPSASVFLADFSLLVPGGAQRIYLIRRVRSPLPPPQSPSLCCPFQTTSRPLLQAASLGRRGPEDMPAMPLSPYTGPQSQGALSSALCLHVCVGGSHTFCATRGLSLSLPPRWVRTCPSSTRTCPHPSWSPSAIPCTGRSMLVLGLPGPVLNSATSPRSPGSGGHRV